MKEHEGKQDLERVFEEMVVAKIVETVIELKYLNNW